jgi:hypothetical protein
MKKLVIAIGLLAGATAGYTQGVVNWTDEVSAAGGLPAFSITIWGPGVFTPGTGSSPNNTSADSPPGTATYTGAPLSGTGFEVGLYDGTSAGAVAIAVAGGTPIGTSTFLTGADAGTWNLNSSLTASDPLNPSGTGVFVELAAWSTAIGAPTTYAAALADGDAVGLSGVSTGTTTLGGGGSPPATPGTLAGIGIQDFQLSTTVVPEPSTIALGVIGASTFLLRLRRKQ